MQKNGLINLDDLENAITDKTSLVSIMGVNNEIGVCQPLKEIGAICRKHGVYFHSDCAQMFGKVVFAFRSHLAAVERRRDEHRPHVHLWTQVLRTQGRWSSLHPSQASCASGTTDVRRWAGARLPLGNSSYSSGGRTMHRELVIQRGWAALPSCARKKWLMTTSESRSTLITSLIAS